MKRATLNSMRLLLLPAVLLATVVAAQTPVEDVTAAFDETLEGIALNQSEVERLEARAEASEGLAAQILETRRDRVWVEMFNMTVGLAEEIRELQDDGVDMSAYSDKVAAMLEEQAEGAFETIDRLASRVEFPSETLPPQEFVVEDQQLFRQINAFDEMYGALIRYVHLAEQYDLDSSAAREVIVSSLTESAANRSTFLELAIADVSVLTEAVATLPDDQGLAQWLSAVETRVKMTATALQAVIALMESLDLETSAYRKQVLTVTGEITADVLDVGIMANLIAEWSRRATSLAKSDGPRIVFQILFIALILFLALHMSRLARKGTERALSSSKLQMSNLLRRMITSIVGNLVILIGVLIALGQVGVSIGPVLAGLGIVGFIVGFALQDTLSNFASGIMILFYRPFDVGDIVDAGGVRGKVSHMSLVNTTFMTLDNQKLIVPNNLIWGAVITNVTAQRTRRIDLTFDVSYEDDTNKVEEILQEIVDAHDAVLSQPEPLIKLNALAESSVQFILRPWVRTDDYWDTYWDLIRTVKRRFDEEGITIPYPHRTLEMKGVAESESG